MVTVTLRTLLWLPVARVADAAQARIAFLYVGVRCGLCVVTEARAVELTGVVVYQVTLVVRHQIKNACGRIGGYAYGVHRCPQCAEDASPPKSLEKTSLKDPPSYKVLETSKKLIA